MINVWKRCTVMKMCTDEDVREQRGLARARTHNLLEYRGKERVFVQEIVYSKMVSWLGYSGETCHSDSIRSRYNIAPLWLNSQLYI